MRKMACEFNVRVTKKGHSESREEMGGLLTLGILAVVLLPWLYIQPIENEDPLQTIKVVAKAYLHAQNFKTICIIFLVLTWSHACFSFSSMYSGADQLLESVQRFNAEGQQRAISYRQRCRSSTLGSKRTVYQNSQPFVC